MTILSENRAFCESCPFRVESVFFPLNREKLRALERCKVDNRYRKGQIVFQEGTPAQGVYCVYEGQLKMYKTGGQGRPQIIGIAKSGTLMGHRALLTDRNHSFTAESLGDAHVCYIDQKTFFSMVSSEPAMAQSLLRRLALELDSVEDRLIDVVEKPVQVRLALLLLSLRESYGRISQKGTRIALFLTREEMAEMIGTTQETTIRLLSQFRKMGMVRLDRKYITLLDPARLSQLAAGAVVLP